MLISFCVAIYNVEKYLNECIDSILSQTDNDYEVLIIDDGSTDKSGIICDSYKNCKNVRIIHKDNEGVSETRNLAIEEAKGDWIFFVDGDDVISKYSVSTIKTIASDKYDVLLYKICRFNDGKKYEFRENTMIDFFEKETNEIIAKMIHTYPGENNYGYSLGTIAGKIYRTDYLKEISISFNKKCIYAEDFIFGIEALCKTSSICFINSNPLYGYRINDNSLGRKYHKELNKSTIYIVDTFIKTVDRCLKGKGISDLNDRSANRIYALVTKPLYIDIFNLNNNKSLNEKKKDYYLIFDNEIIKQRLNSINYCNISNTSKILYKLIKNNNFYLLYLYFVLIQILKKN